MLRDITYKSILCLDGKLPDPEFFKSSNLPIIAADGAANKLLQIGIKPDIIIGDLDSIAPDSFKDSGILIIKHEDQNLSDFQKSLLYSKENNLYPSLVTGVSGGFLDHIFNNINIIIENSCGFYAPPIYGFSMNISQKISLSLAPNTKISLFGFNDAMLTTKGLKWNLDKAHLNFPGFNSSLNRVSDQNVEIDLIKGSLIVMIYQEEIIDASSI